MKRLAVRLALVAAAALLIAPVLFVVFVFVGSSGPLNSERYDRDNADYRYVTAQVALAADQRPGLVSWQRNVVDLWKINEGNWQFICVIGAYNDPAEILKHEAARRDVAVKSVDPVPKKFLGLSPIEEGEGALSFVDRAGRGRTVLVDGFERLAVQNDFRCYGAETNGVLVPISSS